MNPSQLWETTLDTNARSLLQVSVKEIDEANTIFDELMGDKVEPRRVFIEQHALTASVDVSGRPAPEPSLCSSPRKSVDLSKVSFDASARSPAARGRGAQG